MEILIGPFKLFFVHFDSLMEILIGPLKSCVLNKSVNICDIILRSRGKV